MNKFVQSLLTVAMFVVATNVSFGENEAKPLVTVSFAGYDKLLSDVDMVGKLGGNANMGSMLDAMVKMLTQGKGLVGFDTKRPCGACLLTDGQMGLTGYGFLPVTHLKDLMDLVQETPQLRKIKIKESDGIYEVRNGDNTVFVKQQGDWAVIARSADDLSKTPKDVAQYLGDLPAKYNVAVRVSVKNIPSQLREYLLAQMQAGSLILLEHMPREGSGEGGDSQANMVKQGMEQVSRLLNELDELLLGWNVDSATKTTYLDLVLTARSGTAMADQLAQVKAKKSRFAGFVSSKAAVSGIGSRTLNDADVVQTKAALTELEKRCREEIGKQNWPEEETKLVGELLTEVAEVAEKTIDTKQIDGGVMMQLGPNAMTLLGGCSVADGAKLESVLKRLVDAIKKNEPNADEMIKLNAETYEGVRFHTLSIATPDPSMTPFFGGTFDAVVGIGDDRLFVSAGRDATKKLKEVLDQCKAGAGKDVLPLQVSVAMGPMVRFAASVADDETTKAQAEMMAGMLEKAEGKDHIVLTSTPIERGVRVRLEVETGLLKLVGTAAQMGLNSAAGGSADQ